MLLESNIGFSETLEDEFKEFILKLDLEQYYEKEDIKNIIINGKLDYTFNQVILDNLEHYFKYYLPRYISIFGNSKLKNGNLYFGINDFGEITGIPYLGELNIDILNEFLSNIYHFVKNDKYSFDEIKNKINIELIKVDIDTNILDDNNILKKIIKSHFEKFTKYKKEYEEYIINKHKWIKNISKYTISIITMGNNPIFREEIIKFIKKREDYENYTEIIKFYESDSMIDILTADEITARKTNMNDIIYWVASYKDSMVDYYKSIKPERVSKIYFNNIYVNQLLFLTNLRERFIKFNKNINYYVIKFTIPTNIGDTYYRNLNLTNKWMMRRRQFVNGNPGCL